MDTDRYAGSPLPAARAMVAVRKDRRARSDAPHLRNKSVFIRAHPWLNNYENGITKIVSV
jgi:hypothetical protein